MQDQLRMKLKSLVFLDDTKIAEADGNKHLGMALILVFDASGQAVQYLGVSYSMNTLCMSSLDGCVPSMSIA